MEQKNSINVQNIDTITIDSIGKLVDALKDKLVHADDKELFFRGESKDFGETRLIARGIRPDNRDNESIYYYDMLTNFPQEFDNLPNLSRLAKMQHYGCPTRLLDLTSNPLIALYFACAENDSEYGCFYIFKTKTVLNYDSDKALLLSCFSHLNKEQQDSVYKFIDEFLLSTEACKKYAGRITNEYIEKKQKWEPRPDDSTSWFQFSRFIGEVVRERPAFTKHQTVATDLLSNYVVRTLVQNERQKKQEGLFLIFGLQGDGRESEKSHVGLDNIEVFRYRVESGKKDDILKELNLLGINEASVYCGIENRVNYLNSKR